MNKSGFSKIVSLGVIAFLIGAGILAYVYYVIDNKKQAPENKIVTEEINVPIDGSTCDASAGEKQCELTDGCIATTDECTASSTLLLVEKYLRENISILSPLKEVLGGKFTLTGFRPLEPQKVEIDYEDGHIAFTASVAYKFEKGKVEVTEFVITKPDLADEMANSDASSSPETDVLSDGLILAEAKKLLAYEYGVSEGSIIAQISDSNGGFVRGEMVIFTKEKEIIGKYFMKEETGKMILAYSTVLDVDCSRLVDFPISMLPECK